MSGLLHEFIEAMDGCAGSRSNHGGSASQQPGRQPRSLTAAHDSEARIRFLVQIPSECQQLGRTERRRFEEMQRSNSTV
jgi:hypothetical protein